MLQANEYGGAPEPPRVREMVRDVAIALLAAAIPLAYDRLASILHLRGLPGTPFVEPIAFICAFLIVYAIQLARWTTRAIEYSAAHLKSQISTDLEKMIEHSFTRSVAGILLSDAAVQPNLASDLCGGLHNYLVKLESIPAPVRRVAHLFSEPLLETWVHDMSRLQHEGLDLNMDQQMKILSTLSIGSQEILFIDPIVYDDIEKQWSSGWKEFIIWLGAQRQIKKDHVILCPLRTAQASERATVISRMQSLKTHLKTFGFGVWYCDVQDILDSDPTCTYCNQCWNVIDKHTLFGNTAFQDYTGGKKVNTTLSPVHQHESFIRLIVQFRKQIPLR